MTPEQIENLEITNGSMIINFYNSDLCIIIDKDGYPIFEKVLREYNKSDRWLDEIITDVYYELERIQEKNPKRVSIYPTLTTWTNILNTNPTFEAPYLRQYAIFEDEFKTDATDHSFIAMLRLPHCFDEITEKIKEIKEKYNLNPKDKGFNKQRKKMKEEIMELLGNYNAVIVSSKTIKW